MAFSEPLTQLTAKIAASFVARNRVATNEVGELISSIGDALAALGQAPEPVAEKPVFTPAVSIRKSLADPAKIISMIDGKRYSTLSRHLTSHQLTPAMYRERYSLPADYPMVAPAYSEKRKALARAIGLGRKPAAPDPAAEPDAAAKPARRPRQPKAKPAG